MRGSKLFYLVELMVLLLQSKMWKIDLQKINDLKCCFEDLHSFFNSWWLVFSFYTFRYFVKFSEHYECKQIRIIWENCNFGTELILQGKQWLMLGVYVQQEASRYPSHYKFIGVFWIIDILSWPKRHFSLSSCKKHEKMHQNQNHCKKASCLFHFVSISNKKVISLIRHCFCEKVDFTAPESRILLENFAQWGKVKNLLSCHEFFEKLSWNQIV